MSFGLGVLRLSPAQFWAMTPRELDAAMRGLLGPPVSQRSPARSVLDTLMQRYPDSADATVGRTQGRPAPTAT